VVLLWFCRSSGLSRLLEQLRRESTENVDLAVEAAEIALSVLFRDRASVERLAQRINDQWMVNLLRARSSENRSIVYAHHVYAEVSHLSQYFGLIPSRVLEIGPGMNLGTLFCFRVGGTMNVAGVDIAAHRALPLEFYKTLARYLSCVEGFRWWQEFADTTRLPYIEFPNNADDIPVAEIVESIEYHGNLSAENIPYPDENFDLIYSNAALEHVEHPDHVIAEQGRILSPAGLAIHEIDLKHHGKADPLQFLELSDETYLAGTQPYGKQYSLDSLIDGTWKGDVYCNRWRLSDWIEGFCRGGFDILFMEPIIVIAREKIKKERFAPRFRDYTNEDLSVLAFRVVVRKCEKVV